MPINSFSPPRIVIDTNSPAHAESSPHVRRTLDINRESDIHAVAGTPQTPISIHALRKESDPGTLRLTKRSKNFNPHSPCGERPARPSGMSSPNLFQSTLPLRGATYSYWISPSVQIFQSTLPLRGATFSMRLVQHIVSISIHTPLAGSDGTARPWSRPCGNFNPHSPCGERRGRRSSCLPSSYFNPHSPCGERRGWRCRPREGGCNFNPHSPCGERLALMWTLPV